ncbi:MAG TPA: SRPBCC family protein [Pseudomonadales bacterium]
MNDRMKLLLAAGMGAAAMYYFDPARGRYRRALLRDGVAHAGHKAQRELGVVGRDTRNRTIGLRARLRNLLSSQPPDDEVLVSRVRACLGRVVSHPSSIEVDANDGVIKLSGPILEDEVPRLLRCARRVPGVRDVQNALEVHAEPGRVPGLQGNPPPRNGERSAFRQENWAPATRAAGALAGTAMTLYGLNRRNAAGALAAPAGLLLLARALTNIDTRRLLGIGEPERAIIVQKSIRIHAPVDEVFRLCSDFERLPAFATHVQRVQRVSSPAGEECWRWTVDGPGGLPVEFDARITEREENRLLAWQTQPHALVRHTGRVRFLANADGSTTMDVKMSYLPAGGVLGHAVAWLLGADPKHQMNDDLLRMKTFLETGKRAHDAAAKVVKLPKPDTQQAAPTA